MNRIDSLNVHLTKEKNFFTMIQQQKRSTSIFFRDSMHRNRYMQLYIKETDMPKDSLFAGAYQMEPPSPIQALGVNSFPSRFIIRTVPRGDFARRRWEEPITRTK